MRKVRKILLPGQVRKPINELPRFKKRLDSTSAFVTAVERVRLDTLPTERSRVNTSFPVYPPLLNQIIPPPGTVMPPIEISQQDDQSASSFEIILQPEPVRESPTAFICTLCISLILGSLQHSWWVLGESLLIGLILTGIMFLSDKRETFQRLMSIILWFLFALVWGYIGWLICDSYMPLIIHLLCAFIGFILGAIGYPAISGSISPVRSREKQEIKPVRQIKQIALTTLTDSICISLAFSLLLHSWWILGGSLLVGLLLTGIIVLSVKDNVHAFDQTSVTMIWFLFALMWGYAGWFICDVHVPSIIHFLCALIGFILGAIGYPITYAILTPADIREQSMREIKRRKGQPRHEL